MRRTFFKTLILGTVALTFAACSESNTTSNALEEIREENEIVIGVKTDYVPFGFIDENGDHAGLEIDIARYLAKEIVGSEDAVEFVPVVAANRIEFLQQGRVDLVVATMNETDERREVIDFSENYYASGTGLLTRKDSGVATWEDLQGKKVCGIQGSFYNKELSEMGIEMVNFPGTAEAYTALQDGRCVGFAYDNSAIAGKLLEPEWSQDWHQPETLEVILIQPWGIGVRKDEPELLEAVNEAIIKMEAEGLIVEGEQKWNIPPTEYAEQRSEQAKQQLSTVE